MSLELDLNIIGELLPWGLKLRESSGSSSHWGIFEYLASCHLLASASGSRPRVEAAAVEVASGAEQSALTVRAGSPGTSICRTVVVQR